MALRSTGVCQVRSKQHPRWRALAISAAAALAILAAEPELTGRNVLAQQGASAQQGTAELTQLTQPAPNRDPRDDTGDQIRHALIRLPLAALLGAALALRPQRRGTPKRTPAVVQTQIILAIVGSLIMLVVGASLARAFGIVGAANLIRYRSKVDDPKDAGVMLCSLALGLAVGVGLYALSGIGTAFLVVTLAVIESFEPKKLKHFLLQVKVEKDAPKLRPKVEAVLNRFEFLKFELRGTADDELTYDVNVPMDLETDAVTDAIVKAGQAGVQGVTWDQKKKADE